MKIVFDTSSLLRVLKSGKIYDLLNQRGVCLIIPPEVVDELKDEAAKVAFESVKEKILVMKPNSKSIEYIRQFASKTGDLAKLSRTDMAVLALAYQEKAKIATEDFAIQNVAHRLGIGILSFLGRKIKKHFVTWKKCRVCGAVFPVNFDHCPECGSKNYVMIRRRYKPKVD